MLFLKKNPSQDLPDNKQRITRTKATFMFSQQKVNFLIFY